MTTLSTVLMYHMSDEVKMLNLMLGVGKEIMEKYTRFPSSSVNSLATDGICALVSLSRSSLIEL